MNEAARTVARLPTRSRRGYVHIYTGDGKGKTTAALGLALRAAGRGLKVCVIQFLKGKNPASSGECARKVKGITIIRCDQRHPLFRGRRGRARDRTAVACGALKAQIARDARRAGAIVREGRYDVVILDEVINCASQHLLDEGALARLIESKPANVELVLTGRGASRALIARADYVTMCAKVKHPFDRGVRARRGIEF